MGQTASTNHLCCLRYLLQRMGYWEAAKNWTKQFLCFSGRNGVRVLLRALTHVLHQHGGAGAGNGGSDRTAARCSVFGILADWKCKVTRTPCYREWIKRWYRIFSEGLGPVDCWCWRLAVHWGLCLTVSAVHPSRYGVQEKFRDPIVDGKPVGARLLVNLVDNGSPAVDIIVATPLRRPGDWGDDCPFCVGDRCEGPQLVQRFPRCQLWSQRRRCQAGRTSPKFNWGQIPLLAFHSQP